MRYEAVETCSCGGPDWWHRRLVEPVTPNYEAAVKLDWKLYDKAASVEERAEFVRQIVDAALEGYLVIDGGTS